MNVLFRVLSAGACIGCAWLTYKIVQLWRAQEPVDQPPTWRDWLFAAALILLPPAGAIVFAVLALKP